MRRHRVMIIAVAVLATSCTAYTWGWNDHGELGDGRTPDIEPGTVGIESDWGSVTPGDSHNCGLRGTTLWCWGRNYDYELGLGGRTSPNAPQQHPGSWLSVATGWSHTCAVQAPGTMWCAGSNHRGQLGLGWFDTEGEGVETLTKAGTDTDWASVAAGVYGTCATKTDNSLWCWGANSSGQIGDGTTTDRADPTQVGTDTDWADVAVRNGAVCATRLDTTLWCWGGLLAGAGASTTPIQVGTATGWQGVSGSQQTACAVRSGELWCWGRNDYGQIGDGTTTTATAPVRVGTGSNWATVGPGTHHTCATRTDATMWCWGRNNHGQLGTGDLSAQATPVEVGAGIGWASAGGGGGHSCAVEAGGALRCWGRDDWGQLGHGPQITDTPGPIATATEWLSLGAGGHHTCGVDTSRALWCWGDNSEGQLGLGDIFARTAPTQVGTDTDWASVAPGREHTCATRIDHTLWCWGNNADGQLGRGESPTAPTSPGQVGTDTDWRAVTTGDDHSCATRVGRTLWCWGRNDRGQLGLGWATGPDRTTPVQVGSATDWASVSAGGEHTCATNTADHLWCWGSNNRGQLGQGDTVNPRVNPKFVMADVRRVAAGWEHTCAVKDDASLWCWGSTSWGQLGLGTGGAGVPNEHSPAQVGTATDWLRVAAGTRHSCGIRSGGALWCWGGNDGGQVGDGTTIDRYSPTQAGASTSWVEVSAAAAHTVAMADEP